MKYVSIIILTIQLLTFQTSGQTLVFYKEKDKGEYHFYVNEKLSLFLKDGSKHKGQISAVNVDEIILDTKRNGSVTISNSSIQSFSVRRHILYFGPRLRSLIQYNLKRDLTGFNKYRIDK